MLSCNNAETLLLFSSIIEWIRYPSFIFFMTWVIVGHCYTICDFLQPSWYQKCNLTNQKFYQQIDLEIYLRIIRVNYQNLLLLGFCYFICTWLRFIVLGSTSLWSFFLSTNKNENGIIRFCFEIGTSSLFSEVFFFGMHRFAHLPITKKFHKMHHEFSFTGYALVGLYCSWQELVFINFPLGLLFPILVQMHWFNVCVFVFVAAINVLSQHSFHQVFPEWIDNAAYHMKHHQNVNQHYAASWTYKIAELCFGCYHEFPPSVHKKKYKKSKRCD